MRDEDGEIADTGTLSMKKRGVKGVGILPLFSFNTPLQFLF